MYRGFAVVTLFSIALTVSQAAQALDIRENSELYDITSVSITETTPQQVPSGHPMGTNLSNGTGTPAQVGVASGSNVTNNTGSLGAVLGGAAATTASTAATALGAAPAFGELVAFGALAWNIVINSKPVTNLNMNYIHAIPSNSRWEELEGWQDPTFREFSVKLMNKLNLTAVDFKYRIHYTYGGSYKGKGKYLASVSVQPKSIKVYSTYGLNVSTNVENVYNAGTAADPIAAVQVLVSWTATCLGKNQTSAANYLIKGTGDLRVLE